MNTYEVNKETFKVTDLKSATWCMEKIRDINNKINEKEEIANEIISRAEEDIRKAKEWLKEETEEHNNDKNYLELLLTQYYQNEKRIDKKFKLKTPFGVVTSRKDQKWNYDEEKVIEYCKREGLEFVKVSEKLDKSELKKICKNGANPITGELIDGIEIVEEENISVKVE